MLSVSQALEERKETPALVVVTTAFQLALVVLVWLLALVPAAVAALTMFAIKTLGGVLSAWSVRPRED